MPNSPWLLHMFPALVIALCSSTWSLLLYLISAPIRALYSWIKSLLMCILPGPVDNLCSRTCFLILYTIFVLGLDPCSSCTYSYSCVKSLLRTLSQLLFLLYAPTPCPCPCSLLQYMAMLQYMLPFQSMLLFQCMLPAPVRAPRRSTCSLLQYRLPALVWYMLPAPVPAPNSCAASCSYKCPLLLQTLPILIVPTRWKHIKLLHALHKHDSCSCSCSLHSSSIRRKRGLCVDK